METTDWERYGTGRHEKCANCMAHCGYEATAADAALRHPLSALWLAIRGLRTQGPMAPEPQWRPRKAAPPLPRLPPKRPLKRRKQKLRQASENLIIGRAVGRGWAPHADLRPLSELSISVSVTPARWWRSSCFQRLCGRLCRAIISRSIPMSTPCCPTSCPGASGSNVRKRLSPFPADLRRGAGADAGTGGQGDGGTGEKARRRQGPFPRRDRHRRSALLRPRRHDVHADGKTEEHYRRP